MQAFDASSMIYAWDNYPIFQFPGLWEWMENQIQAKKLVMPGVAFDEVAKKTPDCGKWLKTIGLDILETNNAIVQEAMRIKGLLDIVDDKYHAKGVGENDLIIIASARIHGMALVSDEERQTTQPEKPSKRKIPAVCAMAEVRVSCLNFIEYIKMSHQVFR